MSNKTPASHDAATESAHSRPSRFYKLVFGLALVVFGSYVLTMGVRSVTDDRQKLITKSAVLSVEVVETPEKRTLGLSGRTEIGADGMLFVFEEASDQHCFWMKDMQFSIDMVWLDEEKRVVHVERGVEPASYPQTYCPVSPARYVLEVDSERSEALGLNVGEQVRF